VTFDDIVIGSGLSALGVILGLPARRKILVIAGPAPGRLQYYDGTGRVPSAYLGRGGLGRFWHGVIPSTLSPNFTNVSVDDFVDLFTRFYPYAGSRSRIGTTSLFVPYRPIRPLREWRRAEARGGGNLVIVDEAATRLDEAGDGIRVVAGQHEHRGARLWIAAGALHTPALVRQLRVGVSQKEAVSDHVIVYAGQIDRRVHRAVAPPSVTRTRDGIWTDGHLNSSGSALFTLRPARFSYKRLDEGVEQRAVFGLPTGGMIAKLARAATPGLLAEAMFNKFGLFPNANMLSVYAQLRVPDGYALDVETGALHARRAAIVAAIETALSDVPWAAEMSPTRRRDLYLNGIHLHGSLDAAALEGLGINRPQDPIQIVDASVAGDIGCEHHSFKLMAGAFARARRT
jgi:hypothetical protein